MNIHDSLSSLNMFAGLASDRLCDYYQQRGGYAVLTSWNRELGEKENAVCYKNLTKQIVAAGFRWGRLYAIWAFTDEHSCKSLETIPLIFIHAEPGNIFRTDQPKLTTATAEEQVQRWAAAQPLKFCLIHGRTGPDVWDLTKTPASRLRYQYISPSRFRVYAWQIASDKKNSTYLCTVPASGKNYRDSYQTDFGRILASADSITAEV